VPDAGTARRSTPRVRRGGRRVGHRPPAPGDIVVGPESSVMPSPGRARRVDAARGRRARGHHPAVATVGDEGPAPHPVAPPPPPRAPRPDPRRPRRSRRDRLRHRRRAPPRLGRTANRIECGVRVLPDRTPANRALRAARQRGGPALDAFDGADELTVCGVAAEEGVASSNVFDVARYDAPGDIPRAYRPGAPYLQLKATSRSRSIERAD